VISGLCWLGMLLGLLIHWTATGKPHYPWMDANQNIAYISDVGAGNLKPLFIAGSAVTTIFLDISFLSERWLRHRGRLAANETRTEKVLAGLSIVFAIIGTCGLILLSIFDTARYPRVHDVMLLLFIVGYVISAVFICWEYQRLGIRTFTLSPSFLALTFIRFPSTQSSPRLFLDQALLHPNRGLPRDRVRRMQLSRCLQRRSCPGMGRFLHFHVLRVFILH
jgi:hypothetical protein